MSHPLYEQMENAGLLSDQGVDRRKIAKLSATRLIDLSLESADLTAPADEVIKSATYSHAASLSLGGGSSPCGSYPCREKRLDELSRFAALYSDRVYVHNLLSDLGAHTDVADVALNDARRQFSHDLRLLAHIRPLVDAGRVVPISMRRDHCPHCVARQAFGENADKRSIAAQKTLSGRFLSEVTVALSWNEDTGLEANLNGPDDLIEHGESYWMLDNLPKSWMRRTDLIGALQAGESVPLTKRERRTLGLHHKLTSSVLNSLSFEMAASQTLQASVLTERALDVAVLNGISDDPGVVRRNQLVQQHLKTIVPFAGDVPISRLLELRRREEESFLIFRQALNIAVDEWQKSRPNFSAHDAKALYHDVIAPALAKLDQKVKSAKRDIRSDLARSAAS